jgi:hypothetical protein
LQRGRYSSPPFCKGRRGGICEPERYRKELDLLHPREFWEARLEPGRGARPIPDGEGCPKKEFSFAMDIRTLVDS